jgi:methylphosphotriester-DNA--protein-cysteine methyltransferase
MSWFGKPIAPGKRPLKVNMFAYLAAVHAFNAGARTCPACARIHPLADLGDIAWAATAAALR